MIYIAKIAARRKILGLDENREKQITIPSLDDPDADVIPVPALTGEDVNPNLGKDDAVDQVALQNLDSTPALTGAIPVAIFDAAMKQFENEESFGKDFYDMVAKFDDVRCVRRILSHIVESLLQNPSSSYLTHTCHVRSAVAGIRILSADFPPAFGVALERLKTHQSTSTDLRLSYEAVIWLLPMLKEGELDPRLKTVCSATIRKMVRNIGTSRGGPGIGKPQVEQLASSLKEAGLERDADILSTVSNEPS